MNASKTNYMILGTPGITSTYSTFLDNIDDKKLQEYSIILDNSILDRVQQTKFLGVIIDDCLTWKDHINCISKTVSRNIGVMHKLKHFIPDRILFTLYCTLILPYLNYGILIWGKAYKIHLQKLIKLQKWVIRTISNSHFREHTPPLFAKYNVLNVEDMYNLELGTFMFKYATNELPISFKNYFTKRSDIHNYKTRHASDLNMTKNMKAFSDHSIRTTGPIFWNSLHKSIKDAKKLKHFRYQLKQSLLSNYN